MASGTSRGRAEVSACALSFGRSVGELREHNDAMKIGTMGWVKEKKRDHHFSSDSMARDFSPLSSINRKGLVFQ